MARESTQCQEEHLDLLFRQIPEVLMPEFRPEDQHTLETGNSVGNFRLICRCEPYARAKSDRIPGLLHPFAL